MKFENVKMFLDLIHKKEVVWHPTTPKNFECVSGCCCCCADTYFFSEEIEKLPPEIKEKTYTNDLGFISPLPFERSDGGCIFFKQEEMHCSIHKYRPLRCQIYPFVPIILNGVITIVTETFTNVVGDNEDIEPWHRCYGLGKGPDISKSIEEKALKFLRCFFNNYNNLTEIFFKQKENLINKKCYAHHTKPIHATWEEALKALREDN